MEHAGLPTQRSGLSLGPSPVRYEQVGQRVTPSASSLRPPPRPPTDVPALTALLHARGLDLVTTPAGDGKAAYLSLSPIGADDLQELAWQGPAARPGVVP